MRIKKLLLPALLLAACGTYVSAQTPDENQAEESSTGTQPKTGTAGSGENEKKTARKPTLFVPRETISPDSVIAFPADI